MYAEKVVARYEPHSNPVRGVITPTALSKVGKYGCTHGAKPSELGIEFYFFVSHSVMKDRGSTC